MGYHTIDTEMYIKLCSKMTKRAEKLSDVLRNLNKDKNELSFQALCSRVRSPTQQVIVVQILPYQY